MKWRLLFVFPLKGPDDVMSIVDAKTSKTERKSEIQTCFFIKTNKKHSIEIILKLILKIQRTQLSNGFVKERMLTDLSGDGIRKEM